ncbi:MAG: radical SAM protein [Deltaproteobacteria bacterium]|nr:radical SAM protein [Deltaproteobacteria bacterium]
MDPTPIRHEWKSRAEPGGLHLFDRVTGLNVLLDEIRVAPQHWSTAPRQVSVALTNACDLSCSFCFAPKRRAELPFETLIQWLVELDEDGCLGVGFGGGEPTKYPRFVDLCRLTARRTQLAVTFTTHGHSFDRSLAAKLKGSVHFIRVSMDGVGTTYEALRGRPFSEFLVRLDVIKSVAPFGINFLVNAQTIPCLDTAARIAGDFGAAEFLLLPEREAGSARSGDTATALQLRSWVERYRGSVPLSVSETDSDGLPTCSPFRPDDDRLGAYAHVDAQGVLKPTSFDEKGIAIGEGGIRRALRVLRDNERQGPT